MASEIGVNLKANLLLDTSSAQRDWRDFITEQGGMDKALQNGAMSLSPVPISPNQTAMNNTLASVREVSTAQVQSIRQFNTEIQRSVDLLKQNNSNSLERNRLDERRNDNTVLTDAQRTKKIDNTTANNSNMGNNVIGGANVANNLVSNLASGSFFSGFANVIQSAGSGLRNQASKWKQDAAKEGKDNSDLTNVLGALGVAGIVAGIAGKATNTAIDKYESHLNSITGLTSTFGGESVAGNSRSVNAELGMQYFRKVADATKGTGMSIDEFSSYANELGQYGINDIDKGMSATNRAARYARYTNGDTSQMLDFMGTMSRYGSKNIEGDLDYAYAASRASGLSKNQFPEFLTGLQRVIEDGIAKGYVKSSKDVAETMTMFSKLSGGSELWKGEQGINRLMTMNSGLASQTNLHDTTSLLAYQTFNQLSEGTKSQRLGKNYLAGGGYINSMMLMEQGFTGQNFKEIAGTLGNTYGGDAQSEIEAWKKMSGLNYTGAVQLYKMAHNGSLSNMDSTQIQHQIESMKKDPNLKNDETRRMDVLVSIDKSVSEYGKMLSPWKYGTLEHISNMVDILAKNSIQKEAVKAINDSVKGMYDDRNDNYTLRNKLQYWAANGTDEDKVNMLYAAQLLNSLTPEQKGFINLTNLDAGINTNTSELALQGVQKMVDRVITENLYSGYNDMSTSSKKEAQGIGKRWLTARSIEQQQNALNDLRKLEENYFTVGSGGRTLNEITDVKRDTEIGYSAAQQQAVANAMKDKDSFIEAMKSDADFGHKENLNAAQWAVHNFNFKDSNGRDATDKVLSYMYNSPVMFENFNKNYNNVTNKAIDTKSPNVVDEQEKILLLKSIRDVLKEGFTVSTE